MFPHFNSVLDVFLCYKEARIESEFVMRAETRDEAQEQNTTFQLVIFKNLPQTQPSYSTMGAKKLARGMFLLAFVYSKTHALCLASRNNAKNERVLLSNV